MDVSRLLAGWDQYRQARSRLLETIDLRYSNRDPMSEFSEALVSAQVGGTLAASRVQRGYDLIDSDGLNVQVKYLANPATNWINEHHIKSDSLWDRYEIVFYEALSPRCTVIFPAELGDICTALAKRHGHRHTELQLTRSNYSEIIAREDRFRDLGVEVMRIG